MKTLVILVVVLVSIVVIAAENRPFPFEGLFDQCLTKLGKAKSDLSGMIQDNRLNETNDFPKKFMLCFVRSTMIFDSEDNFSVEHFKKMLHTLFTFESNDPETTERVAAVVNRLTDKCSKSGGSDEPSERAKNGLNCVLAGLEQERVRVNEADS